jgi:hypothetical protein
VGSSARWHEAYSKLSLVAVEVCKVDQSPISIIEDLGSMVQGVRVNSDWTQGVGQRLHADLFVLSQDWDHNRASVLGQRMVRVVGIR